MKVLVTGARGFIGQWVCKSLSRNGVEWRAFEGDVLRFEDFLPYSDSNVIVHLAAKVRTQEPLEHLIRVNLEGVLNTLRFARAGGRKVIFASSYLYGNPKEQPIKETHPTTFTNAYSFSKWQAEQAIIGWHEFLDVSSTVFRIFNAYGPGQPLGFLIPDIFEGIKNGRVVLKDRWSRRDFIFVEDLAELIVAATTSRIQGLHFVNAASGVSYSVTDVVNTIFDIAGFHVPVESHDLPIDIPDTVADIESASQLFGWYPKTSLDKGITRIAASLGLLNPKGDTTNAVALSRFRR